VAQTRLAAHQKKAKRLNATLVFVDESGFSLNPFVAKTWGNKGQTPVLTHRARHRRKVSVIAGVSVSPRRHRPGLVFQAHADRSIDQHGVLDFLKGLLRHYRGHVIVVWDNLNTHRSKLVKDYVAKHPRLHLEYLPPYAPELNPSEWHWKDGKCHALANHGLTDADELYTRVIAHAAAAARDPPKLRGYIRSSELPWRIYK